MLRIQGLALPPWMVIAQNDIGVRERRGRKRHHPRIVEYHRTTTLPERAHRDEVPWCSSAINCWVEEAGYEGTDNALAASWIRWGVEVGPRLGAIVVLRRRARGPAEGGTRYHVTLFAGAGDYCIRGLGGNQRNAVRYSNYSLRMFEVVAERYPVGYDE